MRRLVIISMVAFLFAACTTLNQNIRPDYKVIDHKGVLAGVKVPSVIKDAMTERAEELTRKYFPDSYVFVANQKGRDLDGLMMWSKNFVAQTEAAKRIQTHVDFVAKNSTSGGKDSIETTMDIVTEIIAKQNISGLQMQQDWWIQIRHEDGKEEFQYVAVYAIKKSLLDKFMNDAMSRATQNLSNEDKATVAKFSDDLAANGYGLEASEGELSEVAFDSSVADSK